MAYCLVGIILKFHVQELSNNVTPELSQTPDAVVDSIRRIVRTTTLIAAGNPA
jgi:hypothetical protein